MAATLHTDRMQAFCFPHGSGAHILSHSTQSRASVFCGVFLAFSREKCDLYGAGGSCLICLHVRPQCLAHRGCQIVFWGVTALQGTKRQAGDACGHSRLNSLRATVLEGCQRSTFRCQLLLPGGRPEGAHQDIQGSVFPGQVLSHTQAPVSPTGAESRELGPGRPQPPQGAGAVVWGGLR